MFYAQDYTQNQQFAFVLYAKFITRVILAKKSQACIIKKQEHKYISIYFCPHYDQYFIFFVIIIIIEKHAHITEYNNVTKCVCI